jgi:hypothetical protein
MNSAAAMHQRLAPQPQQTLQQQQQQQQGICCLIWLAQVSQTTAVHMHVQHDQHHTSSLQTLLFTASRVQKLITYR